MKDQEKKQQDTQNYGATNNRSPTTNEPPFNTIVTVDSKNKNNITSSSSDLNRPPPPPPRVTLSTSYPRIVINHPPPTKKQSLTAVIPFALLNSTKKKAKKTSSTENLISRKENEPPTEDSVKKSKTIHEISYYDNKLPLQQEETDKEEETLEQLTDETSFDVRKNENHPEIRIESVTSDELDEINDDKMNHFDEDTKAAQLLTMSQTEENLLQSEVSSINEDISTDSDDSELWSENNLQPYADYVTLKESSWSINNPSNEEEK